MTLLLDNAVKVPCQNIVSKDVKHQLLRLKDAGYSDNTVEGVALKGN